jgi:hypothetical protein
VYRRPSDGRCAARLAESALSSSRLRFLSPQPRRGWTSTDTGHGPPFKPLHEQQSWERNDGAQQGEVEHGSPGASEYMPPRRPLTLTHSESSHSPEPDPMRRCSGPTPQRESSILTVPRSGPLRRSPQGARRRRHHPCVTATPPADGLSTPSREGMPPGEARRHTDSHGGSDQSELRSL